MTSQDTLVIGIGSPDAGDDAVGPAVAEAVRSLAPPGVEVLAHEDPTDLTLLWQGRPHVVVIDAVRSGAPVGTVRTLVVSELTPLQSLQGLGSHGSHDFGVGSAVALSEALGTLPGQLAIVTVEGLAFRPGAMTPLVRAAVPTAVEAVLEACRQGMVR
ncbi:hydrogenase maturation protease [Intrasporangium sp. DVR]|uniref:hydrogenase maturation protease n=1 Tax=Intrasporangium sp. DVR TaxID=3127867 RepID=UPI00313A4E60